MSDESSQDEFRFNYARDKYYASDALDMPGRAEELTARFQQSHATCSSPEAQSRCVKALADVFINTILNIKTQNTAERAQAMCAAAQELYAGLKPHRDLVEQTGFSKFLEREANTLIEMAEHQTNNKSYEAFRDMAITVSDLCEDARNPAPAQQHPEAEARPAYKKPARFTL